MVVRRDNCSSMALSSVGGAIELLPAERPVDGDMDDDSCLARLTFRFFDVPDSSTTEGLGS